MVPILAVIGVFIIFVILTYNGMIAARNEVKNVMGSVDAALKKRFDLIPNLVATVQQYAAHEKTLLNDLTALRARAMNPASSPGDRMQLDTQLNSMLKGLMVSVEGYPDLKANTNFVHLQQTLHETEEQILASRRAYNAAVTHYNNKVQMFPGSLFASIFNFGPAEVLRTPEPERANVNVRDLFKS